jgi:hypothetical protein
MVRFKWKKRLPRLKQQQAPLSSGVPSAWKTSTTKPLLMLASIVSASGA